MDLTYEMIAQKANEFGLYISEFFINNAGEMVCYWNKTGNKKDGFIVEGCFAQEKQPKGAFPAKNLENISINFSLLGIAQNDKLPYGGFFQLEAPGNEAFILVCMYGGIVDKVSIYFDEKESEKAWSTYTGIAFSEFEKNDGILTDTKCEGSTIYVTKIESGVTEATYSVLNNVDERGCRPAAVEKKAMAQHIEKSYEPTESATKQEISLPAKIEVECQFGKIVAEEAGDNSYPGIYLYFVDKDGMDIDAALLEVAPTKPANGKTTLRLLVWSDVDSDSHTHEFPLFVKDTAEN